MKGRVALPAVMDVGVELDRSAGTCRLELFCEGGATPGQAAALKAALVPALTDLAEVVEIRIEKEEASAVGRPTVDYADPLVRAILATLLSTTHRHRLVQYGARCMAGRNRESVMTADDLVEDALVLLLAGELEWRGSLERLVGTLCATMRNLSLNPRRFERKLESVDTDPLQRLRTDHGSDREAHLVLLRSDVAQALTLLNEDQRAAVISCWMNAEPPRIFAASSGRPASRVRVQLHRARPVLQEALASYRSPLSEAGIGYLDPRARGGTTELDRLRRGGPESLDELVLTRTTPQRQSSRAIGPTRHVTIRGTRDR